MQLHEEQIPQEPLADDGTILHAMERLILVAANLPGKIAYKVMSDKFDRKLTYYENQLDFETQLKDYNGPKVYSFYLPQFHAIAENDLWHGKGFTEWVKVRSAQPLFEGHYQQHVPHPDFGYYEHTEDSEIFSKQARAMKNAGVDGQIFYHYWFQGKLILEGPARRLLEDASIDMPFAFCWANENWTRRWDGLEDDVLLRQDYDLDDATNFIRYLIPFFKDSRYIRRDGSVLLIVYNADKNPLMKEYASIWERECASEGITIHLVYVLRGEAKHPAEFGMSAALERPLSNWAYGRIRDVSKDLHSYSKLKADILSYSDVVSYFKREVPKHDFEVVPSLLPGFDNTARYGGNAHVVHESLPDMFSDWLRDTIDRAQELSEKNRFVVINAWNEWAEGAHLEPDLRFGYAFLNAVGRAKLYIRGD
jgi:lipopolysaccharide biosynthesis protein